MYLSFSLYLGVLLGKKFFDQNWLVCQLVGAICLVTCVTSLISIGFLAFNRYVFKVDRESEVLGMGLWVL